ncbi:MAG: hypothetical protein ACC658_17045, partial [Acidimicrobiia bacterium]
MTDDVEHDHEPADDSESLESNALTRERLAKYRKVMEDGGFPYSFRRTDTATGLAERFGDLDPGAS